MAGMSDYLEGKIRGLVLRNQAFTTPTHIYIGLSTTTVTDAGSYTEPSGSGYARQQLDPSTSNWTATSSTDGVSTNVSALTFTASGGNWGTITDVFLVDASSSGNMLFCGPLSSSRTINDGDSLTIGAGSLSITFA